MTRFAAAGVLVLVCAACSVARAQPLVPPASVTVRGEHYVDDDRTTVWRPRVSATVPAGERVAVSASYMADVVSSASIDVVTRATQAIDETRHEGNVAVVALVADRTTLGASYGYAREPDYESHVAGVSATRYLDEARSTLVTTRFLLVLNRVGTVVDPRFERVLTTLTAAGGVTRVVNRLTLVRGTLELAHNHGFQSSAYRTVRLGPWVGMPYTGTDPDAGEWVFTGVTASVIEHHPDDRFRARLALDAARAFGRHASFVGTVAGYLDSWRVGSGELIAELRVEPTTELLVRLGARGYFQSSAWFFRYRYEDAQETRGYVTDDKELGPMRSGSIFAAIAIPLGRGFRLDARIDGTRYAYPRFSLLPHKHALATQIALSWSR